MKKIQEHFLRYEFKYILGYKKKAEVESELSHFMQLDPFVKGKENNRYFVRSLYFDDPVYSFYHEKTDGLMHRQKMRIRTYSQEYDPKTPILLELKGRYNNFVYKNRIALKHTDEPNETSSLVNQITNNSDPVSSQFTYDLFRKRIKPVMLIDYQRRAYQSKFDYEFRITFDSHLTGTETNSLFPSNGLRQRSLIDGFTIMEVKFRRHMPPWFHRIMLKHQLERISISKYCTGMESTPLIEYINE